MVLDKHWKIGINVSVHRELISHPVPATKTGQAYSRQYRATPSVLNILAMHLPGIFVRRHRPFAYKRGIGDVTTVSGLGCGERSYLWLTWNRKGMVLHSVLSTNTKQASPQSVRFHVNILQARTAVGSVMRFYRCIYSSVH